MKKLLLLFCVSIGFLASAQQKEKDSADISKEIFEYKPRLYRPSDCFCPNPNDHIERKNFNPYSIKNKIPSK